MTYVCIVLRPDPFSKCNETILRRANEHLELWQAHLSIFIFYFHRTTESTVISALKPETQHNITQQPKQIVQIATKTTYNNINHNMLRRRRTMTRAMAIKSILLANVCLNRFGNVVLYTNVLKSAAGSFQSLLAQRA